MNAKYTPGPWVAFIPKLKGTSDIDESGNSYWNIEPESFRDGKEYLQLSGWMSEENARLIAAAPELLEALRVAEKALIDSFECFKSEHGPILNQKTFGYLETLDEVIKYSPGHVKELIIVRAAIAKATGQ